MTVAGNAVGRRPTSRSLCFPSRTPLDKRIGSRVPHGFGVNDLIDPPIDLRLGADPNLEDNAFSERTTARIQVLLRFT